MNVFTIAALAAVLMVAGPPAFADSISEVEGARAYERQGAYLTRQDREKLRRYGGNDDGFYSGRYGYDYGYRNGPSVGVYIGPRYDRRGYYGPYGY
jgi:hypothetical protein